MSKLSYPGHLHPNNQYPKFGYCAKLKTGGGIEARPDAKPPMPRAPFDHTKGEWQRGLSRQTQNEVKRSEVGLKIFAVRDKKSSVEASIETSYPYVPRQSECRGKRRGKSVGILLEMSPNSMIKAPQGGFA